MKILKERVLGNRQYISIIRLFDHCGINTDEDINIPRIKKQMQAEFSISRTGFIEVEGYSYTRNDVFEELDRPDFTNRLIYHKQIWSRKKILQLLENNTADLQEIEPDFRALTGDTVFDEFFSPYFVQPFSYLSRTLLTAGRLKEMGYLLSYEDFLLADDKEEAFKPVRIFFEENLRVFRNINGENYSLMRSKITHWINTDWHWFFNRLPDEFYDVKSEMVMRLINVGVAIQKSHRRDCKKMSRQLISLQDIPEQYMHVIVKNDAVYRRSRFRFRTNKGSGYFIAFLIMTLVRIVGTNGCNTGNTGYSPGNIQFKIDDSTLKYLKDTNFLKQYDSNFLKHRDSLNHHRVKKVDR